MSTDTSTSQVMGPSFLWSLLWQTPLIAVFWWVTALDNHGTKFSQSPGAIPSLQQAQGLQATPQRPSVFDLPRLQTLQSANTKLAIALMQRERYSEAETLLRKLIEQLPYDSTSHYNLACALARQGKTDEAFSWLEKSIELGFRNPAHIKNDVDLTSLHNDLRFTKALLAAKEPLEESVGWQFEVKPAVPAKGKVVIDEENTAWNRQLGMFQAFVKLPKKTTSQVVAGKPSEAGKLLTKWYAEGTAAGNLGDLYDNHDNKHSTLRTYELPQVTHVEFSDALRGRNLHRGVQTRFLYNAVTIGNSSTAITRGPNWRSQGRLALTQPGSARRLYLQYRSSHVYFYPEHRDHDPGHNGSAGGGHGDVFPANTPYMIISQGSSGTDRAFMNAVGKTLAAFRPEVKKELAKAGLLMPTVQMILRMSNKQVAEEKDYLTGKAHPTVFDGKQLNPVKMVTMAHDMQSTSLPPLAVVKMVEEDLGQVGTDYFDVRTRERVFDTPCAIARVVKSTQYERRMVVQAGGKDLRDKPLKYHWVVLRGDPERIRIKSLNDEGNKAEIVVGYHPRRPITAGSKMESNRVDIGVFAHNGEYYSPPAFISLSYPDNETRVYDEQQRLQSVDYKTASVNYVDPVLDAYKDWRDEYRYGEDGSLMGWTRIRADGKQQFAANGELVLVAGKDGKPLRTQAVRYRIKSHRNRLNLIQEAVPTPGS